MRACLAIRPRALRAAASLLAAPLAEAAAPRAARAQDVVLTSAVAFVVTDSTGVPIPYAQILEMPRERLRGVANARGEFSGGRWPLGTYQLAVRRIGYRPREFALDLREPDSVRVRVHLAPVPRQLEAVATAVPRDRLADFERRRTGPGVFYDRAEIDRRRPQMLTDMLRTTPGLTYSRDGSGQMRVLGRDVSIKGGCPMEFFLDNVPIGDNVAADRTIDMINVAAIEVYRGPTDVPAAYRGHRSRCGLVLVWTRIE